jgi:NTE family protein
MAFFSSWHSEADNPFLAALFERLRGFALLDGIADSALKRLLSESSWFGLPGGVRLKREGDDETALFLVVTGCLGVLMEDEEAGWRVVSHVPPGETVGELSFLSGDSTELVALRDTEILRISRKGFEALVARHPHLTLTLLRVMARRLTDTTRNGRERARPKTFAVVPLQDGLGSEPVARLLADALLKLGSKAAVLDVSAAEQASDWFHAFEAAHDVVFYRGDEPDTAWTQLCVRQADRILLLARSDLPVPARPLRPAKERVCGLPELILLHSRGIEFPDALAARNGVFEAHHHLRDNNGADIARLARAVTGRAVALVLGGGGARGFAHIGVVKALVEAGVSFDSLGGVSMGAIIAAGLAAEWSIEELSERMRAVFVTAHPLSDYTLPLIALVRGRNVSRLMRRHFGSRRIEALPKPFFCISADLTTGHLHEHVSGMLWRALRASAALPGILPPVPLRGHLLVDGGVMNNLPVDLMRKRRVGPLIASDVTGEVDFSVRDNRYGERPVWRLLWQRMRGTPSIFDILMRAGTLGSEAQRRLVRDEADFLYEPLLPGVEPLDWKCFERAVAEGYEHTARHIEQHGIPHS